MAQQRNLPARGFRPGVLLLGMGAIMTFGWYKLIKGMREVKYVVPDMPKLTPPPARLRRLPPSYHRTADHEAGTKLTAHSELGREKIWARIYLTPVLQAEEDRDQVRRHLADQAREKELMGENARVYHSDRFVRPTFAVTPKDVTK